MTTKPLGNFGRLALWLLPFVVVVVGLVVAMPWVKQQNPGVANILGTVGAIFVMGYSLFMASRVLRWQRRLDEVQIASQGFANSYGWVWGGMAAVSLLMVPPVMNWLIDLVNAMANVPGVGSPDTTNHRAVRLAFFYGISLTMVLQGLAVGVASFIWWRRMGGLGEPS